MQVRFLPSFPPIFFGLGAVGKIGEALATTNITKPLIITDKGLVEYGVLNHLTESIPSNIDFSVFDDIPENPTILGVENSLNAYRENGCNGIIALGGGSVLDSGKALRVITNQDGRLHLYLKDPSKVTADVAPYITIPSTAGTGAEITWGGGIHPDVDTPAFGLRSPYLKPDIAICDPEITRTLPPKLTAATGMDAITHCVEGYLSNNYNPISEAVALDGIKRVISYIGRAFRNGEDMEARENMSMAAIQGGIAIEMGLGPIHALSMAFSDAPLHHGTLVTVSMPAVMRFYNGLKGDKLDKVAIAMGLPEGDNSGNRIAEKIEELNLEMSLPSTVRQMGYKKNDLGRMIEDASSSHFNLPAPKKPTKEDYKIIIEEVLG